MTAALSHKGKKLFSLPVFDHYSPTERSFTLLNIKHTFPDTIDWEIGLYGRLWTYHLNYFGWLGDESLSKDDRLETLRMYATNAYPESKTYAKFRFEPYPVSVRGMAAIRFLLSNDLRVQKIAAQIYKEYGWLYHFPEYQLQGNHLWQNGCSLLCAGWYYGSAKFYRKGKRILKKALTEQVLPDGGHIEGSPMYHSLLLSSLMQCIELAENLAAGKDENFVEEMRAKAALMLGWAEQIAFGDGTWPRVNDSTGGMAPELHNLQSFAAGLKIAAIKNELGECGYRMLRNSRFELFADVGSIQPAWQPGHAHSDELSFCLYMDGKPLIVDRGIHTYEANITRLQERGSDAHNVLSAAGKNASDVWKSFRVGKKATVMLLADRTDHLAAQHDGYGFRYTRKFFLSESVLRIEDTSECNKAEDIYINLHFAPGILVEAGQNGEFRAGDVLIKISNNFATALEVYSYALAFNKTIPAWRLRIKAGRHTITSLEILNAY